MTTIITEQGAIKINEKRLQELADDIKSDFPDRYSEPNKLTELKKILEERQRLKAEVEKILGEVYEQSHSKFDFYEKLKKRFGI